MPGEAQTILCNCLAHEPRLSEDVYDRLPDECGRLLEVLAVAIAPSPEERQFHQQESRRTMQRLHEWLSWQLEQ